MKITRVKSSSVAKYSASIVTRQNPANYHQRSNDHVTTSATTFTRARPEIWNDRTVFFFFFFFFSSLTIRFFFQSFVLILIDFTGSFHLIFLINSSYLIAEKYVVVVRKNV